MSLSASGLAAELKQPNSAAREALALAVDRLAGKDPEFVLKVGLNIGLKQKSYFMSSGCALLSARVGSPPAGQPAASPRLPPPRHGQPPAKVGVEG